MKKSDGYKNEKLCTFCELLNCVGKIYISCYDAKTLEMLFSTAPNAMLINALFVMENLSSMKKFIESNGIYPPPFEQMESSILQDGYPVFRRPLINENSIGMVWISDMEFLPDDNRRIHVMGPVYVDEYSVKKIERQLNHLQISVSLKKQFLSVVKEIPMVPMQQLISYTQMFHYCLSGERIRIEEIMGENQILVKESMWEEQKERMDNRPNGTYFLEQHMLDCVRQGNLQYKDVMEQLSAFAKDGSMSNEDYIRQGKNSLIVFTALCSRAAIEGGLPPETAYRLSDDYIQKIEKMSSIKGMGSFGRRMLGDFIERVHRIKNAGISSPIQKICDRVSLYPGEKKDLSDFAKEMGYAESYLGKKFRKEVGCTFAEYRTGRKMERAKELLTGTEMSLSEIADALSICSQSYFGKLFQRHTGKTPQEYRNHSG